MPAQKSLETYWRHNIFANFLAHNKNKNSNNNKVHHFIYLCSIIWVERCNVQFDVQFDDEYSNVQFDDE